MAYNVQFKKVWLTTWDPSSADPHVFYAVYETKQEGVGYSNLKAFYLGGVELSDTALASVVSTLDAKVVAEIERAKAAEKVNSDAIAAEASRAKAAEEANATAIADETTRAKDEEGKLQTAIANEEARAKGEEKKLSDKIDADLADLKNSIGNLSNIMNFKGVVAILPTLDTVPSINDYELGDVVVGEAGGNPNVAGREFVLVEVSKDGTTSREWVEIGYTGDEAAAIAALQDRATALEGRATTLETEMDAVEVRATDLETRATTLESGLASEIERAKGAEATNAAAVVAEHDRAVAEEARLDKAIADEAARADAAEKKLADDLAAEVSRAKSVEASLDTRITNEVSTLNGRMDTELATLRGGADASVTIGKLVGAINQLVDGTADQENTLKTVSHNVTDLDTRVKATESLLTWQE
jgi:hypothetical protein